MTGSNRRPSACKADALPAELILHMMPGNVLLSQGREPQLPSALKSLTSVFGMGTGVASSPSLPDYMKNVESFFQNWIMFVWPMRFVLG